MAKRRFRDRRRAPFPDAGNPRTEHGPKPKAPAIEGATIEPPLPPVRADAHPPEKPWLGFDVESPVYDDSVSTLLGSPEGAFATLILPDEPANGLPGHPVLLTEDGILVLDHSTLLLLEARDLTQEDVAELAGMSTTNTD